MSNKLVKKEEAELVATDESKLTVQQQNIYKFIALKENASTADVVDHIMQRLGHGASHDELVVELKLKYKILPGKAAIMIDVITDVAFRLDPNYVAEIAGQIRYSVAKTLEGIDKLLDTESAIRDQKELLKMRLHAIQALQKLLPTQIDINTKSDDGLRNVLFDLHGIDKEE